MDWFIASSDLLSVLLRVTVVLAVAVLLTRILHRTAAETRHRLWTTTFVLLLALPLGMAWMPTWDLEILPLHPAVNEGTASHMPEANALPPEPGVIRGIPEMNGGSDSGALAVDTATHPTDLSSSGSVLWETVDIRGVLLWIWVMGCIAALLSLLVGTMRYQYLVRKAIPVDDAVRHRHMDRICRRLGIGREVRLLISSQAATPMASGWWKPVIVLPLSAATWSEDRFHVVLMHELVHIRRHDVLRQWVGHITLALYWFHPLSWIAAQQATISREQACDEAVLALGTRPSAYATHLLDLADTMRRAPSLVTLPMIQKTQLEKRLMAILQPNRPHRNATVNILVPALIVVLGLTAAIARPVQMKADKARTALPEALDDGSRDAALLFVESEPTLETTGTEVPLSNEPAGISDGPAEPVTQSLSADDPTCQTERFSGNFSGTFTTYSDGNRRELSGLQNGDRIIQKYDGALRLCMRLHGEVVMADNGTSVRAIGTDSWVVLESENEKLHRLIITEGDNGIEYAWSIDGRSATFDADARSWRDQMFTLMQGYWEASRIRGEQSSLRGRISSHRGHVSSLRGRISSHRGHVSSLRGQISSSRGRVSSLRGRISSHRGHVSSLRGRISSHKGHVSSLRGRISSLRGRMSGLRSMDGVLDEEDNENLDQMRAKIEDRIRELEQEIEDYDLDGKVQALEQEIQDYDLDAKIQGVEAEMEQYDVGGKVGELEQEIEDYDLEGKVEALEQEVEDYDLEGKVEALEQEIEDLNADERAEAIEDELEPELDTLRSLINRM